MLDDTVGKLWRYIVEGLDGPASSYLSHWVTLSFGFLFSMAVIILLLLLGKYFVKWGYDEIYLSFGRDSLAVLKRPASGKKTGREPDLPTRRQRRLPAGMRRRRKP